MCGLWGAATTTLVGEEKEVVQELAMVSAVRGIHSAGIAVARRANGRNTKHSYEVVKRQVHPSVLILDNEARSAYNKGQCHVVMGHNRWATVGDVTEENAHPFEHRHIIGAHNGSITEQRWTKHVPKGETDSQLLFKRIAEEGLEETLKEVAECDGHYAITYMDMTRHTLNFIRNERRPLWLATAQGGLLFWASERWMLKAIDSRHYNIKMADPEALPPFTHVSVNIGEHPRLSIRAMPQLEKKRPANWYSNENRPLFGSADDTLGPIIPEKHKGRVPPKPEPRLVPMTVGEVMAARAEQDKKAGDDAMAKANKIVEKLTYCITCQKAKKFCNCSSYGKDKVYLSKYGTAVDKDGNAVVPPSSVPSVKPPVKMWSQGMKKNASVEGSIIILPKDAVAKGYYSFRGYAGDLTLEAADELLKVGCSHCTRDVYLSDVVHWLNDDTFVCSTCVDDPFVEHMVKHECSGKTTEGKLVKGDA